MDVSNLTIKIQTSGLETAQQGLDKLGQKAHKAETSAGQLANSFKSLNTVIAGVASSLVVREFIKTADEMSLLNSRLKMTTSSMGEFTRQQQQMHKIARDTHSSISDITDLYVKLSPALKEVGKNTQETNKITESFAKALQLGGANAQESTSAILQFSQAMGRGVLSGQELNAVMAASPKLIEYLAKGMGVSASQIKKLGAEGKLTAEAVSNALLKMSKEIEEDFKNMPLTVGKATTDLQTEISLLISDFDKASGASSSMANGIASIADTIKDNKDDIIEFGRDVYRVFELSGTGVTLGLTQLGKGFYQIYGFLVSSVDKMTGFIEDKLNAFYSGIEKSYNKVVSLWNGKELKIPRSTIGTGLSKKVEEDLKKFDEIIKNATEASKKLQDEILTNTTRIEKYLMQGGVAEALKKMNESTKKTGTTSSKSAQEINSLNRALLEIAQVGMDEYEKKIFAVEQKTKEWIKAGVDSKKALEAQKILLDQIQTENANQILKENADRLQREQEYLQEYYEMKGDYEKAWQIERLKIEEQYQAILEKEGKKAADDFLKFYKNNWLGKFKKETNK
ncbi:tape measure protein, partial [Campylobacter sp. RM16191]|uniref:tape measure protein n=1 Tax=Campylobacter sp. RM16191 TaxID=1705728 RepID=UPI0014755CBC